VKRYRDENPEKIAALKRADNRTELAKLRTRRYAMSEKGAANRAATQVRSRRELQTSYLKRVMGLQGVEVPESLLELKREQLLSVRALRELKTVLADIQPQTGDTNVH
jgi:hypothetical protein